MLLQIPLVSGIEGWRERIPIRAWTDSFPWSASFKAIVGNSFL